MLRTQSQAATSVISPGSFFLAYLPRWLLAGGFGCPYRQHGKAVEGREGGTHQRRGPNDELPSSRLEKPSHQHHDGDRRHDDQQKRDHADRDAPIRPWTKVSIQEIEGLF
jgi:hypothetical protein